MKASFSTVPAAVAVATACREYENGGRRDAAGLKKKLQKCFRKHYATGLLLRVNVLLPFPKLTFRLGGMDKFLYTCKSVVCALLALGIDVIVDRIDYLNEYFTASELAGKFPGQLSVEVLALKSALLYPPGVSDMTQYYCENIVPAGLSVRKLEVFPLEWCKRRSTDWFRDALTSASIRSLQMRYDWPEDVSPGSPETYESAFLTTLRELSRLPPAMQVSLELIVPAVHVQAATKLLRSAGASIEVVARVTIEYKTMYFGFGSVREKSQALVEVLPSHAHVGVPAGLFEYDESRVAEAIRGHLAAGFQHVDVVCQDGEWPHNTRELRDLRARLRSTFDGDRVVLCLSDPLACEDLEDLRRRTMRVATVAICCGQAYNLHIGKDIRENILRFCVE